jgi:hypothetical protein
LWRKTYPFAGRSIQAREGHYLRPDFYVTPALSAAIGHPCAADVRPSLDRLVDALPQVKGCARRIASEASGRSPWPGRRLASRCRRAIGPIAWRRLATAPI